MSSENFTVGARCIIPAEKIDAQYIKGINQRLLDSMERKGFFSEIQWRDLYFGPPRLAMTFLPTIDTSGAPLSSRIKKSLHLKSDSQLLHEEYFKQLKNTIDEHPHRVTFTITFGEDAPNSRGYIIRIESEPTVVAKKRHLGIDRVIDDSLYKDIIKYNTNFVSGIMSSFGARILEAPRVLEPRETSRPPPIVDPEFLGALPEDVALCLREANACFESLCYAACSAMMRKTIDVAITKKFLQTGNQRELLDKEGNEISLAKKIDRLGQLIPTMRRDCEQVGIVKWFGDKGAHDSRSPIFGSDLRDNVAPKTRAFLARLELKR